MRPRCGDLPVPILRCFRWPVVVIALLWCGAAHSETQVYLLRGWFGVFSTGMDTMAEDLRAKGINAEAIMHMFWRSAASKFIKERAAGHATKIVLVGHSQGANNAIELARELQAHDIPVDLLITLVPFMQDPVPTNVLHAINYYQSPGWGSALVADPGFNGVLSNIDIAGDWSTLHITIDKSAKVQAAVLDAVTALSKQDIAQGSH
jgi:hypothetical protein